MEGDTVPNNQSDGVQEYNDIALLKIDEVGRKASSLKKVKRLRKIGIIGGIALVGIGTYLILDDFSIDSSHPDHDLWTISGAGIIGCGVIVTSACFIAANNYNKKLNKIPALCHRLYKALGTHCSQPFVSTI